MIRELIGFAIVFAGNVRYREVQGTCEFAAGPVQGIEAWAATGVFAGHLAYYDLGVREDAQHFGLEREGMLQGFEQSYVFGDVVVLMSDPFGDPDLLALRILNDDANPRGARIAVRSAIHVGNKNRHVAPYTLLQFDVVVKKILSC